MTGRGYRSMTQRLRSGVEFGPQLRGLLLAPGQCVRRLGPDLAHRPASDRDRRLARIALGGQEELAPDTRTLGEADDVDRAVEGTQVWVPENVAPVLADPLRNDLPCLWHDPVPADRVLGLGATVQWREYAITVHDLPGHTRYAAAFELEVDGVRVLVTGDQQDGTGGRDGRRDVLNYQYRNRFRVGDYRASAALYRRLAPGLMVTGHWPPRTVDPAYLDLLGAQGEDVVRLHEELLPTDQLDLGADGVVARLAPYRSEPAPGGTTVLTAAVRNPHAAAADVALVLVVPAGWTVDPATWRGRLGPGESVSVPFRVRVGDQEQRRARCALDVTVGSLRLGQHTEALLDVRVATPRPGGP